jgi:hypothetical protein
MAKWKRFLFDISRQTMQKNLETKEKKLFFEQTKNFNIKRFVAEIFQS